MHRTWLNPVLIECLTVICRTDELREILLLLNVPRGSLIHLGHFLLPIGTHLLLLREEKRILCLDAVCSYSKPECQKRSATIRESTRNEWRSRERS